MKKSLFAAILLFTAGLALSASDSFRNVRNAAREAEKNKDWAKAAAIYEQALPGLKPPHSVLALVSMADALVKMQKSDEALAKLNAVAADKNMPEQMRDAALLKAAAIHLAGKNPDAALKIYERVFAETSKPRTKCIALSAIAEMHLKAGKNDEAVGAIEKAFQVEGLSDTEKDMLFLRAADLYLKAGKGDKAEAACRQALAEAGKAAAEKSAKNAEKAAKAAEKGKTVKASGGVSPKVIGLRLKLARILLAQDKMQEFKDTIENTLQLSGITDKQRSAVISARIAMLTQAKKYAEAAALIRENIASAKDPDEMVRLYNKLAEICAAMDDKQGALQALDQAAAVIGAQKAKPNDSLRKKLEKPQKAPKAPKAAKGKEAVPAQ